MKKWKKIFFILCSILFIWHSTSAQNDVLNVRLQLLDSLYQNANTGTVQIGLRIELAKSYLNTQEYNKALNELNKIPVYLANKNQQIEISSLQAILYYLTSQFNFCLQKISYISSDSVRNEYSKEIKLIEILALNQTSNFDSSFKQVVNYIETYSKNLQERDSLVKLVGKLYTNIPTIKSIDKARWIATFIPGGGAFYGGRPLEGLLSLSLQSAALSFAVYQFIQQNYITGYVLGLAVLQKVYFGSLKRAVIITRTRNDLITSHFNKKLIHYIEFL